MPPYLRRSKSIDELIPWLYFKGVSTGDFQGALQALLGADAKGLSANVVVRLRNGAVNTTRGTVATRATSSTSTSGRTAFT